jgi:hypothetical protein
MRAVRVELGSFDRVAAVACALAPAPVAAPRNDSAALAWAIAIGTWTLRIARALGAILLESVTWTAEHTGVPAVVVAAVGIVVSYRIARKTARIVLETSLVVALLLAATHLGWIRF